MAAKKAAAAKGPSNKTQFVLSHPDLSAAEIVSKAKAAGLDLHPGYIYEIRSAARRKGKAPPKAKGKPGRPLGSGKASKAPPKKLTKRAFVLGLSVELPAAEVVKRAKDAGLTLSAKYVYNIRGSAHKGGSRGSSHPAATGAVSGAARSALKAAALSSAHGGHGPSRAAESRFVEAALDVGFTRAEELLGRIRAKVQSLTS